MEEEEFTTELHGGKNTELHGEEKREELRILNFYSCLNQK